MKERPILFSAAMVQAILAGNKTQTRRAVKLPHENRLGVWEKTTMGGPNMRDSKGNTHPEVEALYHTRTGDCITCPHGEPGDQIWVKESWKAAMGWDSIKPSEIDPHAPILFPADGAEKHGESWDDDEPKQYGKLRPSIFMPRWASRIQLEITGIRVERLQDCSELDAISEGCISTAVLNEAKDDYTGLYAQEHYRILWESINGSGSWDKNPFVWVIQFKRIN